MSKSDFISERLMLEAQETIKFLEIVDDRTGDSRAETVRLLVEQLETAAEILSDLNDHVDKIAGKLG